MSVDTIEDFAVLAYREEGRWELGMLPDRTLDDLDTMIKALRQQPGDGGALGLVSIADEFFVVVRVSARDVRLLISDVTAAVADDFARQVVDRLDVPIPDEDDLDDVWPAGDLSIVADLGLDEMELGAILADVEAYPDEMLLAIADRLGFGDDYERALEGAIP